MGWSWAAECGVLGRGNIVRPRAQLVGYTIRPRLVISSLCRKLSIHKIFIKENASQLPFGDSVKYPDMILMWAIIFIARRHAYMHAEHDIVMADRISSHSGIVTKRMHTSSNPNLPSDNTVDFLSFARFKRSIILVNFSDYLVQSFK